MNLEILGLKKDNVNTDLDVLTYMGNKLIEKNYVKSTFIESIINREKEFATGLDVGFAGIAIPHTDSEHVNTPVIAVLTLDNPVIFKQMGDMRAVEVSLICMLALKEGDVHIEMLQKLMQLFQKEETIKKIISLDASSENYDHVRNVFKENNII